MKYCHDVTDRAARRRRSGRNGHYGIDALIQKVRTTSVADVRGRLPLQGPEGRRPLVPGLLDPATHVRDAAGVRPGAAGPSRDRLGRLHRRGLLPGRRATRRATGSGEEIRVFADYLAEGRSAEQNARAILEVARAVAATAGSTRLSTDPAGGSRNPVGPTVIAEYERVGLRPLRALAGRARSPTAWPWSSRSSSRPTGRPGCWSTRGAQATIRALQNYRRAKRGGQWQDYPEDPQHPHEDLVDALRGGLRALLPRGPTPPNRFAVPARQVF